MPLILHIITDISTLPKSLVNSTPGVNHKREIGNICTPNNGFYSFQQDHGGASLHQKMSSGQLDSCTGTFLI